MGAAAVYMRSNHFARGRQRRFFLISALSLGNSPQNRTGKVSAAGSIRGFGSGQECVDSLAEMNADRIKANCPQFFYRWCKAHDVIGGFIAEEMKNPLLQKIEPADRHERLEIAAHIFLSVPGVFGGVIESITVPVHEDAGRPQDPENLS